MKLLTRLKTFLCSTGSQLEPELYNSHPELCLQGETYFTSSLQSTFEHEKQSKHLVDVIHSCPNLAYLLADSGILSVISDYECVSLAKVKQALTRDVHGQSDTVIIKLTEGIDGNKLIKRLEQLIPLCIESIENTSQANKGSYNKAEVENVSSEYMVNWKIEDETSVGIVVFHLNGGDLLVTVKEI